MGTADEQAVERKLRAIAAVAVQDRDTAGAQLAQWVGLEPSPAGEERLQLLARLGPKLVAHEVARAGWGTTGDMWALKQGANLPPHVEAASQAAVRHLNGDADMADAIIEAYATQHGIQGMWDLGTAAIRMLTAEIHDQQRDSATRESQR